MYVAAFMNKVILNILYIYIYIVYTHTELLSKGCMYHIFIFLLKELRDYNEGIFLTVNHWSIYNVLYYISVQSTYFASKQPTGVSARQGLLDILLNYIHIITEYIIFFSSKQYLICFGYYSKHPCCIWLGNKTQVWPIVLDIKLLLIQSFDISGKTYQQTRHMEDDKHRLHKRFVTQKQFILNKQTNKLLFF